MTGNARLPKVGKADPTERQINCPIGADFVKRVVRILLSTFKPGGVAVLDNLVSTKRRSCTALRASGMCGDLGFGHSTAGASIDCGQLSSRFLPVWPSLVISTAAACRGPANATAGPECPLKKNRAGVKGHRRDVNVLENLHQ